MDIEILYVAGCANLEPARRALAAALLAAGVEASVHETEVGDAVTAISAGMRGSPTILIDGVDAVDSDAPDGSVSCRLYRGEGGGLQGAPPVGQLIEALRR